MIEQEKREQREKVIAGLEQFIADFKPFCGNKGDWQRVFDALIMLKSQEPRVMTLEEVKNKAPISEPVWIDDKNGKTGWALKCAPTRESWITFATNFNRGTIISFQEAPYGKKWRCWTSRPTDAQREAEPWA